MSQFANRIITCGIPLVMMGTALAGCITYPERDDFGDGVRHFQSIQTADPEMQPAPQDGERARAVLRVHREDISSPEEVRNEIVINVGSGGQ